LDQAETSQFVELLAKLVELEGAHIERRAIHRSGITSINHMLDIPMRRQTRKGVTEIFAKFMQKSLPISVGVLIEGPSNAPTSIPTVLRLL
jgi:hypothetical protein